MPKFFLEGFRFDYNWIKKKEKIQGFTLVEWIEIQFIVVSCPQVSTDHTHKHPNPFSRQLYLSATNPPAIFHPHTPSSLASRIYFIYPVRAESVKGNAAEAAKFVTPSTNLSVRAFFDSYTRFFKPDKLIK